MLIMLTISIYIKLNIKADSKDNQNNNVKIGMKPLISLLLFITRS